MRKNWERAIEAFEKAIDLGIVNEEYYYELGLSYVYLEDCEKGEEWLRRALELNPQSQPALQGLQICAERAQRKGQ
jgi:tetratricopeptide (TPR) repeat protein